MTTTQAKRHDVATDVGTLAVWESGAGDAVVLRHGIFFDHELWRHQAEALAETHRVIAIDAPGHGLSGRTPRRYTLAEDARATLEVLDALGVDRAVLVGHSWGGMSAVRTALAAPERVRGLGLIDSPLEPSSPLGRVRYAALAALLLAIGTPSFYGSQVALSMFGAETRARRADLTADLQRLLSSRPRRDLVRAMDAVLVNPDTVLERLGELAQPIMVLAGDDDYVLPPTTRDALARLTPHATVDTIPGLHTLPLEQPEETTARLREFLRRVDAEAR